MARVCCVEGCRTETSDDLIYFQFPVAPALRRKWRALVPCGKLSVDSLICSRHFRTQDYETVRGKVRLRGKVVPCPFNEQSSEKTLDSSQDESNAAVKTENQEKQPPDKPENDSNHKPLSQENSLDGHGDSPDAKVDSTDVQGNSLDFPNGQGDHADGDANSLNGKENKKDIDIKAGEKDKGDEKAQENGNVRKIIEKDKEGKKRRKKKRKRSKHEDDSSQGTDGSRDGSNKMGGAKSCMIQVTPDFDTLVRAACSMLHADDAATDACCTIECVPEALITQESDSGSERELHKEDIEDIIANYHIKQDKKVAERLKAAQLQENQENDRQRNSQGSDSQDNERQGTDSQGSSYKGDMSREGRDKSASERNDDPDVIEVEFESPTSRYIEISVDQGSKGDSSQDDCLMVLEKVEVSIDPREMMEHAADDLRADPISLLTSSDDDDVIVQEPHIDIVEVSDETDEDDVPLMQLVRHVEPARSRYAYHCYHCKYQSCNRVDYARHSLTHSRVIQMCDVCEFTTASNAQFARHKRKHKDEKRFKCHMCEFKARYNMTLIYHMKSCHDASVVYSDKISERNTKHKKNKFRCTNCSFRSAFKVNLVRHTKVCSKNDKWHKCDVCDYETKRKSDLKRHKISKHKEFEEVDDDYEPK